MFYTRYQAVCFDCGDICEYGGTSQSEALIVARQSGWQAEATQWIFGGVEVEWDFFCPTHRTDLG